MASHWGLDQTHLNPALWLCAPRCHDGHLPDLWFWNGTDAHWFSLLKLHWVCDCYKWVLSCIVFMVMREGEEKLQMEMTLWGLHCICCAFIYNVISLSLWNTLVVFTCIPFGLWHFLSWVKCVLILWVLPFLLLAASRRHSRSTSALSTADSVGQSGEQALTAWICFLYVVLFHAILTFAVTCISQHLACASHCCEAFCSVLFNVAFSF